MAGASQSILPRVTWTKKGDCLGAYSKGQTGLELKSDWCNAPTGMCFSVVSKLEERDSCVLQE